ncbi:MAG: PspA/IM30 family protein [Bacteroidetes bacterium]|jgi:phage shock protein A|nr:PspA/IM30 family protein [Bacteroidota bacterium]
MSVFKRLFKMGQSELHSAMDQLENPIKLTEQGIRDLKGDLEKALKSLAEVKAMAIRSRNEMNQEKEAAADYEKKAMMLLQKAKSGDMDQNEADRLASEALTKKEECNANVKRLEEEVNKYQDSISKLESNIKTLRSNISKWENELRTLKARQKVSQATKNLNKQMAQVDSSGTVSMLEKMKDKVAEEEAMAEAYGDIANESKSVDDEIDKALGDPNKAAASDSLAELKKKMGM